jgi:hypothetical protein
MSRTFLTVGADHKGRKGGLFIKLNISIDNKQLWNFQIPLKAIPNPNFQHFKR